MSEVIKFRGQAPDPVPEPPEGMDAAAAVEWRRLAGRLVESGALTDETVGLFTVYCQSFATWQESQKHPPTQTVTSKNGGVWTSPSAWHTVGRAAFSAMARAAAALGLTVAGLDKRRKAGKTPAADRLTDLLRPRKSGGAS